MKFYSIWLSLVCILIFILQVLIPGVTDLGILNHSAIEQPWRFVTSIFLHASIIHLIYNLFALLFFGMITEKLIGSRRFLLMFFVSGIIANIISFNFYPSSLGASGAIYGVMGCLTVIQPLMTIWAFSLPMPMFVAAILWVAAGFIGLFVPSDTGHIAHLSGISVGIIFGIIFRAKHKKPKNYTCKIKIPEEHMKQWENQWMK